MQSKLTPGTARIGRERTMKGFRGLGDWRAPRPFRIAALTVSFSDRPDLRISAFIPRATSSSRVSVVRTS